MKKKVLLYLLAAAILAFVVVKIFRDRQKTLALKTPVAAQALAADAWVVRDTVIHFAMNTVGSLNANERVDIESELSLKLISIHFEEGSLVERGRLLFKLDDANLKAKMEKLKVQEGLAEQTEARSRVMLEKGGLSQQLYDEALNNLLQIRAEKALVQTDLDKTEIRAPFSGRLGLRDVSIGALLRPGDKLATLMDVHQVKIDFTVPERYAGSIRKGQTINFIVPGLPDTLTAIVDATQPGVDLRTRTLRVRAVCNNNDGLLVPGTSVKVILDLKGSVEGLYIPTQCLVPSSKGYFVYSIKDGLATVNPVKAGTRSSGSAEILEGLTAGDTLVMTNLLRMKPGASVKILNCN